MFPKQGRSRSLWAGRLLSPQNAAQLASPELGVPLSLRTPGSQASAPLRRGPTSYLPPRRLLSRTPQSGSASAAQAGLSPPPFQTPKKSVVIDSLGPGFGLLGLWSYNNGETAAVMVKKPVGASLETQLNSRVGNNV